MKKTKLILIFCIAAISISIGQTDSILTNKKGKIVLPQKNDLALGISANPFFNYVGNLMNFSGTNSLNLSLIDNNVVYGKYMLTSNSAIRLKLGLTSSSFTYTNSVTDDLNTSNTVIDELESSVNDIQFIPGYEKRAGNSRLQYSYGGEIVLGLSSNSEKYSYGNKYSSSNTAPTTTLDFINKVSYRMSQRITENTTGKTFIYGLRSFVGIEYYILPKICVGTEIGLSYTSGKSGKSKIVIEYWDFFDDKVVKETNEDEGGKYSNLSTDILNGQIYLMFYL